MKSHMEKMMDDPEMKEMMGKMMKKKMKENPEMKEKMMHEMMHSMENDPGFRKKMMQGMMKKMKENLEMMQEMMEKKIITGISFLIVLIFLTKINKKERPQTLFLKYLYYLLNFILVQFLFFIIHFRDSVMF